MIAIAVTSSLSHCGGPILPLRGGRIDALSAGNFGVPEPDTSLEETLAEFASAGFSATDSIALTACGHSLGNVHHAGFPTVADNSTVSADNTGGGQHFDDTPDVFDDLVVREYLAGTGHMGGALVTSFNVSSRSDARLYASDGNETMRALVAQSGTFVEKCRVLFTRMIDTVPAEVVLTDIVEPVVVKPVNVSFDIDAAGHLKFSGAIRYLSAKDDTNVPATGTISLVGGRKGLKVDLEADPDTGYGVFGNTTYFPFSISVPSKTTFSNTFSVELGSKTTNFTIQNQVFFAQSLSSIISSTEGLLGLNISAVVSFTDMLPDKLTASIAIPTPQQLTLSPKIVTSTVELQRSGAVGAYAVFSGVVQVREELLRMTTVDIKAVVGGVTIVDEYNHLASLGESG